MQSADQILGALLERALSQQGREAPALTAISIASAAERFEPGLWVEFSNGYRAFARLGPGACFAFCEQHAAWDLETLRRLLLREALRIYAPMLRAHVVELEREQRAWFRNLMRRLGDGLERGIRSRRANRSFNGLRVDLYIGAGSSEAQERGLRLLKENLSPAQREQYTYYRYFDVSGGKSGKRYRIHHGRAMNVDQIDRTGKRVCGWCFFPEGHLVTGDVMLAQKVALELFEPEALEVANKFF